MLGSGMFHDSNSDSLTKLLADPTKAAETLKKLKAESSRLIKVTKELTGTKSVAAFRDDKLKQADDAIADMEAAAKQTETARKKAYKSIVDARGRLEKREAKAVLKEKDLTQLESYLTLRDDNLIKDEQAVAVREDKAVSDMLIATNLKAEYEGKLADLKQRMKGL